ncbi:MAG: putative CRISPR-associated protein [Phycisphaerales bacterium]|nr:putative CRISPR-associated protein [Phycisphaerales bacterium]
MKRYLCTTGTSIAETVNPMTKHPDADAYARAINDRVKKLRDECGQDGKKFFSRVSAETNSLCAHGLDRKDQVTLFHTQTKDGKICADKLASLLGELLDKPPCVKEIEGLQVTDALKFRRQGVQNLLAAADTASEQTGTDTQVVLNVTGGFKGVVPYLTLYGLLKQIPVIYLFERSNAVITLPPAPLSFDYERLARARMAIQYIEARSAVPREEFFKRIGGLSFDERQWYESLLEDVPQDGTDHVTLSALGLLFVGDAKAQMAVVMLSQEAKRQLDKSSGDRRAQFLFMLQRVGDPMWRRGKQHAFRGTDLWVYKPGNTSERMGCIVRDQCVYVCELLGHDEYERVLPTRNQKDYPLHTFTPWQPAVDELAPPPNVDIFDQLQQEKRNLQEQLDKIKSQHLTTRTSLRNQLRGSIEGLQKILNHIDKL